MFMTSGTSIAKGLLMKLSSRSLILVATLLLAGTIGLWAAAESRRTHEKTFRVALPAGEWKQQPVEAVSRTADWEIVSQDGESVELVVTVRLTGLDQVEAERRFANVRCELAVRDGTIAASVDYEDDSLTGWARFQGAPEMRARLTIPSGVAVVATSTSGDIVLRAVEGSHRLKSTSGDLVVERSAGSMQLSSTSGDVRITGCRGSHSLLTTSGQITIVDCVGRHKAVTTSGDVTIAGGGGPCQIKTVSGDVAIDGVPGSHQVKTVSGDVRAAVPGALVEESAWESVSGDIDLAIADTAQVNVVMKTVSGELANGLQLSDGNGADAAATSKHRKNRLREGLFNGGGVWLRLTSISGHLSLRSLPRVEAQ